MVFVAGDQEQAGGFVLQHSRVRRVEETNRELQILAHKVLQRSLRVFID